MTPIAVPKFVRNDDAVFTFDRPSAPQKRPWANGRSADTHHTANSFTLDPSVVAYQQLAEGQSATVTVNYAVSDGITSTPASVSWTVTGTNDAPTVSATVTGTATEDGAVAVLVAVGVTVKFLAGRKVKGFRTSAARRGVGWSRATAEPRRTG